MLEPRAKPDVRHARFASNAMKKDPPVALLVHRQTLRLYGPDISLTDDYRSSQSSPFSPAQGQPERRSFEYWFSRDAASIRNSLIRLVAQSVSCETAVVTTY
jgi:hypothetical protein